MPLRRRVQDNPIPQPRTRPALLLGTLGLLAGCAGDERKAADPISWWHDLQGGAIAEARPAPPGANDPYRNLATVPPRPVPVDPVLRQSISDSLVADRANAQRLSAASPLPDPTSPAASPAAFGRPAPAPTTATSAPALSAQIDAATAPPAKPVARAATPAAVSLPVPIPDAPKAETALPPLPTAPPGAPNLPRAPVATPAPRRLPPAPLAAIVPKAPPGPPVAIAFAPGAADVPDSQRPALETLAASRGPAAIAVLGFGEATARTPEAQSAALKLALTRAAAVGRLLVADGTPLAALRLRAEPSGTGAVARLLPAQTAQGGAP